MTVIDKSHFAQSGARGRQTTLAPFLRGFTLRRLRLITGMVLFTYVGLHLINHALGNISVAAMEDGLAVQKFVWQGVIGAPVLYVSLVVHFALGLGALYKRRHYGWTRGEIVQLILGLSIPLLLINHVIQTRVALSLYGLEKGYALELYAFHVAAPLFGWLQLSVLLVSWIHGSLGVYFWLRLKSFFPALSPWLAAGAVLIPVLALLGYYQGGREILTLAQDPAWRAATLSPEHVGRPEGNAWLLTLRNGFLVAYGVGLGAILAARGGRHMFEQRGRKIAVTYSDGRSVRIPRGFSILETSLSAGVAHAHFCGGRGRCSTCRVEVLSSAGPLPRPGPTETAVLERIGAPPRTRLACQLRPLDDIAVALLVPSNATAATLRQLDRAAPTRNGEERFVVILVVYMRDAALIGADRLPSDAVFIVDRFIEAVGAAVTAAGGRPSQFSGDGMVALFGADVAPEVACAQAIRAAAAIGEAVRALNGQLSDVLAEPIRFGIGIHGDTTVVGEVGYATTRIYTALGEPPDLASHLEAVSRDLKAEAVISDAVCRRSGLDVLMLSRRLVELHGQDKQIAVRVADSTSALPAGG
jgi:adenylate cyclase